MRLGFVALHLRATAIVCTMGLRPMAAVIQGSKVIVPPVSLETKKLNLGRSGIVAPHADFSGDFSLERLLARGRQESQTPGVAADFCAIRSHSYS